MSDGTIDPAVLNLPWMVPQPVPHRPAARYPAHYRPNGVFIGHMLNAQLRLPARFGGRDDGPVITCQVMNDTGSTIASIWESDWAKLNVNHIPFTRVTEVFLADGTSHQRYTVSYEVRLISYAQDGSIYAICDWIEDEAIVLPDPPNADTQRLSGDNMRRKLWFLTSPLHGNNFLFVTSTREHMKWVLNTGLDASI